jgi:uncharacterized protein YjbI with pentapeptide repeats
MTEFIDVDLRGSRFEEVELGRARFRHVDLSEAEFRSVDLTGSRCGEWTSTTSIFVVTSKI